jgi:type IV pilus assembly protein PilN
LIKINLAREGRAVRGAGAGASPASGQTGAAAPAQLNNIIVVSLLVAGLIAAGAYWFINSRRLAERQATVEARRTEAAKLESIIKDVENYQKRKDSLQQRIDLINQLKQNQKGPVRIMDQISRDLPDLVWIDQMTIESKGISIGGRGLNPNAIANFVENVKNDPYFEEPSLEAMTQVSTTPVVYQFNMSFSFTYTPRNADGTAGATTTTTTTTGGPSGNNP